MKRCLHIVRQEWLFLKDLVNEHILDIDNVDSAVEHALDRISSEQKISRQELIKVILINFRISVIESVKAGGLTFDFTALSIKDICYFYLMHRLKDSAKYLSS